MQIDLNYKIKTREGKAQKIRVPILDDDQNQKTDNFGNPLFKDGEYFTVRKVLEEVCVSPPPKINSQTGRVEEISDDHKNRLFKIFHRVQNSNSLLDLSSDDIALLKPYINRRYNSPLTVGQVFNVIDPHDEKWSLNGKKKTKQKNKDIPSGKK